MVHRTPGAFKVIDPYPQVKKGKTIKRQCPASGSAQATLEVTGYVPDPKKPALYFKGLLTAGSVKVQFIGNHKVLGGTSGSGAAGAGGLGFSPGCRLGLEVKDGSKSQGGTLTQKLLDLRFYNLLLGTDTAIPAGKSILPGGSAALIPHYQVANLYAVYFSADDSIAVLVGKKDQGPNQQFLYKVLDMLTGKPLVTPTGIASATLPPASAFVVNQGNTLTAPGVSAKVPLPSVP
jgi:hypothetical protein